MVPNGSPPPIPIPGVSKSLLSGGNNYRNILARYPTTAKEAEALFANG